MTAYIINGIHIGLVGFPLLALLIWLGLKQDKRDRRDRGGWK
jgi:hypothetical protein